MLEDVSNSCQGKFILVGFSMGGYIAQEFVLKFPERILGFALVAVSADEFSGEDKSRQLKLIENTKHTGFKGLSEIALRKFIHPSRYGDEVLTELIMDMAKASGVEAFISQHKVTMNRRSRLEDLGWINCSVLLMAGRNDQAVSLASIEEIATNISGAELNIIDNCGHMIPLEQPDKLNNILRTWIIKLTENK
jgi:pimeloyl-ACP methyl ester carboxylesterase